MADLRRPAWVLTDRARTRLNVICAMLEDAGLPTDVRDPRTSRVIASVWEEPDFAKALRGIREGIRRERPRGQGPRWRLWYG